MRNDVDFEQLVHDHLDALFRFARSLSRNDADARDLVQETFLRWARKGHQLADVQRVKTWLFTTLYREAAARTRRAIRFPHEPVDTADLDLPDIPPDAPLRTDGALVCQALQDLEEHFRAPVALFYLEDYSYPEIAEILGVPLGTVKSRIARGVAQLQRRFATPTPLPRPARP